MTLWSALVFLFLEILIWALIYYFLNVDSQKKLDLSLKTQANAIMRIVKEKHIDLDSFEPDSTYHSEEDLIWDIIYDVVVFNERNTFIQISSGTRSIYKSANLGQITLDFPKINETQKVFDFTDERLSSNEIRAIQLTDDKYKVIVAYPKEHILQTLSSLNDLFIVMAPIFLIISMIGGYVISQRSLSRINGIINKTEEITAHNLDEKIPGQEFSDEYGRLVKKMNEMVLRIKTSVDYTNQFSISAAHELKTPLTILRGEIELALKSEKTPSEYVEILNSNYEETLRLIKIVDNLFFISKSENNLIVANKQKTDISSFLAGLLKNLNVLASEKGVNIILETEKDLFAEIDNELIKQTMINLIDNAIKYSLPTEPIKIRTKKTDDEMWELCVSNKVENLPQNNLEKIFERFYRLDTSRSRGSGGVGLGLSVVKSIVALHGGVVRADYSNNDLSITLTLPVKSKNGAV